jgi:hypothetical protein
MSSPIAQIRNIMDQAYEAYREDHQHVHEYLCSEGTIRVEYCGANRYMLYPVIRVFHPLFGNYLADVRKHIGKPSKF